jgi:hypothetical protein
VEITAEHAKAVGQGTGVGMKERFFLYGITLDATDIPPRHIQLATPVEADLTNPRPSVRDGTAMTTSKTADALIVEFFVKLALSNVFVNDITQGGHFVIIASENHLEFKESQPASC